jgi:hypothetical protein
MKKKSMNHTKLHVVKGILETSLQVLALASLVHRIGPRRAVRVAAVATEAYFERRK